MILEQIVARNQSDRRRIAVLDDDPTGSQCVHDVSVVTTVDADAIAAGLSAPASTCFVLTNTRALDEAEAVARTRDAARAVLTLGLDGPVDLVSRSDSTLRGHVLAEADAIADVYEQETGHAVDGIVFCPAMMEAGRTTTNDIHYARVAGEDIPVGDTEFARDTTFGYRSSNLRDFLREKSGDESIPVTSIALDTIRTGGVDAVAALLREASGRQWIVVNATEYADLETVVLAIRTVQSEGRHFVFRSGPSLVRPLAGLTGTQPLTGPEIPAQTGLGLHGLIAVGSHVGLTSRQVARAAELGGISTVEIDVPTVLGDGRDEHLADVVRRIREGLASADMLVYTSRTLVTAEDPSASLALSVRVSNALVSVVKAVRDAPAWVVAKGGITSHEVAVDALGIRRARVVGQFLPGQISLLEPVEAPGDVMGTPYVVFPGNVGGDDALATVITVMRDATRPDPHELEGDTA